MNLTLMKTLQGLLGSLPAGVPATRSVTELADGQLRVLTEQERGVVAGGAGGSILVIPRNSDQVRGGGAGTSY